MPLWFNTDGEIPIEAFTTMGINAKPNTDSPIGHFGTGLKYAVAVTLRLGGTMRVFAGETEWEFYLKDLEFRGTDFQQVRMRKRRSPVKRWKYEKLPFTTEYGKDWQPWMALRELWSNTIDEGGKVTQTAGNFEPHGASGKTLIFVEGLDEAWQEETIFLDTSKEIMAENEILEVREGPSDYIFYRGLRITDLQRPSFYTYNFKSGITLTEDRTSKYPGVDGLKIQQALSGATDTHLVEHLMGLDKDSHYECNLDWDQPNYYNIYPSMDFLAALSGRIASGAPVLPRMRTYYESTQAEDGPPTTEIKLLDSEWRVVISALNEIERGDLADKIECEISDEEAPF